MRGWRGLTCVPRLQIPAPRPRSAIGSLRSGRWGLGGVEVGASVADQLVLAAGAAAAGRVGLDVVVEELGGVEHGAVAGQELQLDLLVMSLDPKPDLLRAVEGVAVEDQDDLL